MNTLTKKRLLSHHTVQLTPTTSCSTNNRVHDITVFPPKEDTHNKAILEKYGLPEVWSEVFTQYKLVEKKGQGSYGCVMGAISKLNGQEVAIKMIKNFKKYEYELVKVIREIKIMRALTEMAPKSMSFFPKLIDIIVP